MKIGGWIVTTLLLAGMPGCTENPRVQTAILEADPPAAPGSSAPNLLTGDDGRLYCSWIEPVDERTHRLRFSVRDGDRWSEPRTIASGAEWFVNWADFPSLAALGDGTLAAHWLVRSADSPYAYDVMLSVSTDGGSSWSDAVVPHRDDTPTEHGFVSITAHDADSFRVLWLDGRETGSGHGSGGPMTLRTALLDRSGRVGETALIDAQVCDCCQTAAVRTESGAVVAAYRDRSTEEIRDISIARFDPAPDSSPYNLHPDGWRIAACPVNGPALSTQGSNVTCAWFSSPEGQSQVQVAFSDDDGRSFAPPISLGGRRALGRVDVISLADGSAVVSWLEDQQIRLQRVTRTGLAGEQRVIARTSSERASGFPRTARLGDEIYVGWTEPGEPSRVRVVVTRSGSLARRNSAGL